MSQIFIEWTKRFLRTIAQRIHTNSHVMWIWSKCALKSVKSQFKWIFVFAIYLFFILFKIHTSLHNNMYLYKTGKNNVKWLTWTAYVVWLSTSVLYSDFCKSMCLRNLFSNMFFSHLSPSVTTLSAIYSSMYITISNSKPLGLGTVFH